MKIGRCTRTAAETRGRSAPEGDGDGGGKWWGQTSCFWRGWGANWGMDVEVVHSMLLVNLSIEPSVELEQ